MANIYKLPHNITYSIISSFHTGGIEGDGYIQCDNCNALISRVAKIKGSNSQQYYVGFDCAKTLTGISKLAITNEEEAFKYGTQLRNKLLRILKQCTIVTIGIKEESTNTIITIDADTVRVPTYITIHKDSTYETHIKPQILDIMGVYLKGKKVHPTTILKLKRALTVNMQTPGTYKSTIMQIDINGGTVALRADYVKDGSIHRVPILQVVRECIYFPELQAIVADTDNYIVNSKSR